MEVFHHIAASVPRRQDIVELAEKYQIKVNIIKGTYNNKDDYLFTMKVSESHPGWEEIEQVLAKQPTLDRTYTLFTEAEIRAAPWSYVGWRWEHGYPMLKSKFPYLPQTRKILCRGCFRYEQYAPYRISSDPKIAKNQFFSMICLNELFAVPEVIETFKQQGFSGFQDWDLMLHRKNIPTLRTRQIYVEGVLPFNVQNIAQLPDPTTCPVCGTITYQAHTGGTLEYKASDLAGVKQDFMLTQEWTKNGNLTWREMLISNRVAQCILDHKWKGIQLKAINLV